MELQIAAVRSLLRSVSSTQDGAKKLPKVVCQLENTRYT
jgi:hypothetical protein